MRSIPLRRPILALLPLLLLPILAACEPPEGSPPCTNINGGGGAYDGSTVLFSITLDADPCTDIRYRLFVHEGETNDTLLAKSTYQGWNSQQRVDFAVTVTDDDPTVCVHAETIGRDGKVLDRAPDTGCLPLTVGEDPAGRPFK
jgi:hypothetical protein